MASNDHETEVAVGKKHQPDAEPGKVSERKMLANKVNSAKSTGPKTVRGKATSSRNATKHGILSHPLLFAADGTVREPHFLELQQSLLETYGRDVATQIVVGQLITEMWKQDRALQSEMGVWEPRNQGLWLQSRLYRCRNAPEHSALLLAQSENDRAPAGNVESPAGKQERQTARPAIRRCAGGSAKQLSGTGE